MKSQNRLHFFPMQINTSGFLLGCLGVPPILKCTFENEEAIYFNTLAHIYFSINDYLS